MQHRQTERPRATCHLGGGVGGAQSSRENAAFGTALMAVLTTVKGDRVAVGNYVISQRIILR